MQIAQFVSTYPPYKGGTGNVAYHFAHELERQGVSVTTYAPLYATPVQQSAGVQFLKPLFAIGNGAVVPQFVSAGKAASSLLLHYPFFGGAGFLLLRRLLSRRQSLIVYYHQDLIPPKDFLRNCAFRLSTIVVLPLMVAIADAVLVSSMDYAAHSNLAPYIRKWGSKFHEIPLAVDHAIFRKLPEEQLMHFRAGITERHDVKIISFVGKLASTHYFKGVDVLLEALALVKKKRNDFVCVFAGSGDRVEYYRELAERLGLHNQVLFMAGLTDSEINKLYCVSDMSVLPSINKAEAFGLVLLEALSVGTPVIASDLPGVRTVFESGVSGLAVQPGSVTDLAGAIQYLLTHEDVRAAMGSAAEERAKQFSWKKSVQILITILAKYENHSHS